MKKKILLWIIPFVLMESILFAEDLTFTTPDIKSSSIPNNDQTLRIKTYIKNFIRTSHGYIEEEEEKYVRLYEIGLGKISNTSIKNAKKKIDKDNFGCVFDKDHQGDIIDKETKLYKFFETDLQNFYAIKFESAFCEEWGVVTLEGNFIDIKCYYYDDIEDNMPICN